jgi:hypothetical protein
MGEVALCSPAFPGTGVFAAHIFGQQKAVLAAGAIDFAVNFGIGFGSGSSSAQRPHEPCCRRDNLHEQLRIVTKSLVEII